MKAAVVEAWLYEGRERDLAANALDATQELTKRPRAATASHHEAIEQPRRARRGRERRLEHVRVGKVTALRLEGVRWAQREGPATIRVEQSTEDTAAVEAEETRPFDAAVPSHSATP